MPQGRPRALYLLAHTPFPPVSGGSRRSANIIAALEASFDLTIASADGGDEAIPRWREASRRFMARRRSRVAVTRDAIEGIPRGQHGLLVRSVRAGMPQLVESWLQATRPDLVVLGRPMLAPYIRAAHEVGAHVVVDADESLQRVAWSVARSRSAPLRTRLRFAIEALPVGRMERSSYPLADQLWVSSEEEKRWLATFADPKRIFVIPNAVVVPEEAPAAPDVRAVSFLGWYHYPPNEASALELMDSIMPAIRSAGGPDRLVLIGSEPTATMLRAAAKLDNVTITGQVSDVVPELRGAGVLVVPLRSGGGTRVKILEAAAAGIPVVSTGLGIEGLEMTPGRHVLVAETASEFAAQVGLLASDVRLRGDLVAAAYELVRARHSGDAVSDSIRVALRSLKLPD